MQTAIVYATKHGATAEVARRLADQFSSEATVFNLADAEPDLTEFETVVLGTAIYVGQPMATMKAFAPKAQLDGKRLGLFICAMEDDPATIQKELSGAFPDELHEKAVAKACLGGRFQLGKMSAPERFIIKRLKKIKQDVDAIDSAGIVTFARQLTAPGD